MCPDLSTKQAYTPKMVIRDSAASRKSVVAMALSLSASMGTSAKDFLKVSTMVPPGGMTGADMLGDAVLSVEDWRRGC